MSQLSSGISICARNNVLRFQFCSFFFEKFIHDIQKDEIQIPGVSSDLYLQANDFFSSKKKWMKWCASANFFFSPKKSHPLCEPKV